MRRLSHGSQLACVPHGGSEPEPIASGRLCRQEQRQRDQYSGLEQFDHRTGSVPGRVADPSQHKCAQQYEADARRSHSYHTHAAQTKGRTQRDARHDDRRAARQ